jgi:hypothetical protein
VRRPVLTAGCSVAVIQLVSLSLLPFLNASIENLFSERDLALQVRKIGCKRTHQLQARPRCWS